jgi:cyclopropane fatty-acyl-phospholipid synthase-like methyltransferase
VIKFDLFTKHKIASKSLDTIVYGGSMMDESNSQEFASKIIKIYTVQKKRPFALLDLGCSGGNFVEEIIKRGCPAVGLEGADYSLARQRAAWPRIPDYLFCCDITKPFRLSSQHCVGRGIHVEFRFDAITMWEVIEHIKEDDLPQLFDNITRHLIQDGILALSVSSQQGFHHETIRPREWWLRKFDEFGYFVNNEYTEYFGNSWVRGPNEPCSFNVALQQKKLLNEWRV